MEQMLTKVPSIVCGRLNWKSARRKEPSCRVSTRAAPAASELTASKLSSLPPLPRSALPSAPRRCCAGRSGRLVPLPVPRRLLQGRPLQKGASPRRTAATAGRRCWWRNTAAGLSARPSCAAGEEAAGPARKGAGCSGTLFAEHTADTGGRRRAGGDTHWRRPGWPTCTPTEGPHRHLAPRRREVDGRLCRKAGSWGCSPVAHPLHGLGRRSGRADRALCLQLSGCLLGPRSG